ncbi:MAG: hypothetical protein CL920_36245 [Deltaproteobacteria bacterium]|nr:hypothetical protein [Deltaproteobacteria bacterium]MBU54180.1 hypothetical protein [Deltaproteobacteria bacterium]
MRVLLFLLTSLCTSLVYVWVYSMWGSIGFVVSYTPAFWWPLLFVFCVVYWVGGWFVTCFYHRLSARFIGGCGVLHVSFVVVSAIVYIVYHLIHPGRREIWVFMSLEEVRPYHVQMAFIFFPTLMATTLFLLLWGWQGLAVLRSDVKIS